MAFQITTPSHRQLHPQLANGYPYENKYHNLGQLQSPYINRPKGVVGDYGISYGLAYYTPTNKTYYSVLDKDFRAEEYLPTESKMPGYEYPGYFPAYESKYDNVYVPSNYYRPPVEVETFKYSKMLPINGMDAGMLPRYY